MLNDIKTMGVTIDTPQCLLSHSFYCLCFDIPKISLIKGCVFFFFDGIIKGCVKYLSITTPIF